MAMYVNGVLAVVYIKLRGVTVSDCSMLEFAGMKMLFSGHIDNYR